MSYRARLIVGLVVIELLLGGLWFWLMLPDAQGRHHFNTPDAPRQIGEIMGTAMGAIAGLGIVMFFVAWRRDKARRG